MSQKPENQFVSSVHKYLPLERDLYRFKSHNPFIGGIPDWYYSGKKADMWVEYKFLDEIPKRPDTLIVPALSDLQRKWVDGRLAEGRNVWVVVGCPEGGVVFHQYLWANGLRADVYRSWMQSRRNLADWIVKQVLP